MAEVITNGGGGLRRRDGSEKCGPHFNPSGRRTTGKKKKP